MKKYAKRAKSGTKKSAKKASRRRYRRSSKYSEYKSMAVSISEQVEFRTTQYANSLETGYTGEARA